jgi:hypothetical protein
MRKRYGVMFAVIGYMIFFSCMEGWGADWKSLGKNDEYEFYLDTESITPSQENMFRVSVKAVFTDKGVITLMKLFGTEYKTLDRQEGLMELNCSNKMILDLFSTFHSNGGGVLDSTPTGGKMRVSNEWEFITPGSFDELLYQEICEHPKNIKAK